MTEKEMMKLKRGDKVLVECTVEAVFVKSGMVMVTTRDCDKGFDAYEDEVITVIPDKVTNGDVIKALFPNYRTDEMSHSVWVGYDDMSFRREWWNAPYERGEGK